MAFVRVGRKARWEGKKPTEPGDIEEAAKDLTPREGEDLSVYRVESEAEARKVAVLHAGMRSDPGPIDYTFIPDDALGEVQVDPSPDPQLPQFLGDRHYEIRGLQDKPRRDALAQRSLESPDRSATRISANQVVNEMQTYRSEAGVSEKLSASWQDALGPRGHED